VHLKRLAGLDPSATVTPLRSCHSKWPERTLKIGTDRSLPCFQPGAHTRTARGRFGCKSSGRRRFQRPSKHVAERLGRPAAKALDVAGHNVERTRREAEAGKLDMSLGIFKSMAGVRREPFFRFSLMVARAARNDMSPRATTTWSALNGERLISLSSEHPHQQLIDKHLAQAGVKAQIGSIVNLLDTQIALVEAEEGIAIIPSFGMPACRNRKVVMSQLINPVARFDFHLISNRTKELPSGADEFTSFLKSYIATWAGRAGVL
jgi:DNA-binding transcriptional LysR family regulator